jgi:hypothetical protein
MLNLFAKVLFFMTTKFYLSLRPSIWSEINCKYKHFPRNRQTILPLFIPRPLFVIQSTFLSSRAQSRDLTTELCHPCALGMDACFLFVWMQH